MHTGTHRTSTDRQVTQGPSRSLGTDTPRHRHSTHTISFVTRHGVHTTHNHPPIPVHVYFYRRMQPKISFKKNQNSVKIKKSATKMLGNTRLNYSHCLLLYCSFYMWQSHLFCFLYLIQGTGRTLPFLSRGPAFCSLPLLLSCRHVQVDGFSMVLINLHPNSAQVVDLSS